MLRVKCAHCGAGNRNVTEKDRCFQCENILGDPPTPRSYIEPISLSATVDLATLTADQMPPLTFSEQMGVRVIVASQRTVALAAVATVLSIAFGMAVLATIVH